MYTEKTVSFIQAYELGDKLSMLKLSIICLNQPNCTFDSRVRKVIVLYMLESNVQQA